MGSISVNTTFHSEPPAWQACLWICFGFGEYDYGNKSLVYRGSKLKWFHTHFKRRCVFSAKHKRLSQGLRHHLKDAKPWNEIMSAPIKLLIKTHLSNLFSLAVYSKRRVEIRKCFPDFSHTAAFQTRNNFHNYLFLASCPSHPVKCPGLW